MTWMFNPNTLTFYNISALIIKGFHKYIIPFYCDFQAVISVLFLDASQVPRTIIAQ